MFNIDSSYLKEGLAFIQLYNIDEEIAITNRPGTINAVIDPDFHLLVATDLTKTNSEFYKIVLESPNGEMAGNRIFTNDVQIKGNLTVTGTETISNTETITTTDTYIDLNTGETGAGITGNKAGIRIERGSLDDAEMIFDELTKAFLLRLGINNLLLVHEDKSVELLGDLNALKINASQAVRLYSTMRVDGIASFYGETSFNDEVNINNDLVVFNSSTVQGNSLIGGNETVTGTITSNQGIISNDNGWIKGDLIVDGLTTAAIIESSSITSTGVTIGTNGYLLFQGMNAKAVSASAKTIAFVTENGGEYVDIKVKNLIASGSVITNNTITQTIEDNEIKLNSNVTEAPIEDAFFTVERGTSQDAAIKWDETDHLWKAGLKGAENILVTSDYADIKGILSVTSGFDKGIIFDKSEAKPYIRLDGTTLKIGQKAGYDMNLVADHVLINNTDIASFVSHNNTPSFSTGPLLSRPAAGVYGRVYIAEDEGALYSDQESTWQRIGYGDKRVFHRGPTQPDNNRLIWIKTT